MSINVPTYDRLQVQARPLPAARVDTRVDTGEEKLAKGLDAIRAKEQERQDDAYISDALGKINAQHTESLYGERGVTRARGHDLNTMVGPARQQYHSFLDETLDAAPNARIKARLTPHVQQARDRWRGVVVPHIGDERHRMAVSALDQYLIDESTAAIHDAAEGKGVHVRTMLPEFDDNGFYIDQDRPVLKDKDGNPMTEQTATVESDGEYLLIPRIWDGELHEDATPDELMASVASGENEIVGRYSSEKEANAAAGARSAMKGVEREDVYLRGLITSETNQKARIDEFIRLHPDKMKGLTDAEFRKQAYEKVDSQLYGGAILQMIAEGDDLIAELTFGRVARKLDLKTRATVARAVNNGSNVGDVERTVRDAMERFAPDFTIHARDDFREEGFVGPLPADEPQRMTASESQAAGIAWIQDEVYPDDPERAADAVSRFRQENAIARRDHDQAAADLTDNLTTRLRSGEISHARAKQQPGYLTLLDGKQRDSIEAQDKANRGELAQAARDKVFYDLQALAFAVPQPNADGVITAAAVQAAQATRAAFRNSDLRYQAPYLFNGDDDSRWKMVQKWQSDANTGMMNAQQAISFMAHALFPNSSRDDAQRAEEYRFREAADQRANVIRDDKGREPTAAEMREELQFLLEERVVYKDRFLGFIDRLAFDEEIRLDQVTVEHLGDEVIPLAIGIELRQNLIRRGVLTFTDEMLRTEFTAWLSRGNRLPGAEEWAPPPAPSFDELAGRTRANKFIMIREPRFQPFSATQPPLPEPDDQ